LPLTPNGKIDRDSLPDPDQTRPRLDAPLVAAKTPVEQTIAGTWTEVLGLDRVGIHDDFFELGGHSLMGAGIISRLNETFGLDLPLCDLFEYPTIAQLTQRIEALKARPAQDPKAAEVNNYLVTLSRAPGDRRLFCFPYRGGFRNEYFNLTRISRHFTGAYSFHGLRSPTIDGMGKSLGNVKEIAADYVREIARFQPEGPYYLIGECGGGIMAYEVAHQLQDQGKKVPLLVLFDTEAWSWGSSVWRRFNENRLYRRRFNLPPRRYHMPWIWSYFHARIKLHLKALRQLEGSQRLRYFLDKALRAGMAVPYSLQRGSSVRPPAANANTSDASRQRAEYLERSEKAYFLAAHRQRYRRYNGRIALLINEQWHASDPTLGWDKFAVGGLDVYKIPGNHDTCIPDNIPLVAQLLRECLAKVDEASKQG
jgi:thioesterase domain-containing protein/acyl carrier protein